MVVVVVVECGVSFIWSETPRYCTRVRLGDKLGYLGNVSDRVMLCGVSIGSCGGGIFALRNAIRSAVNRPK